LSCKKLLLTTLLLILLCSAGVPAAPLKISSPLTEEDFHRTERSEDSPFHDSAAHGLPAEDQEGAHEAHLGSMLPLWSVIPFAGILLSIALFPLLAPRFWHRHFPKISAFWALLFAIPFLWVYGNEAFHEILHIYFIDYIPFIVLLWALFTVSGGIVVRGSLRGKPSVNVIIILIGTAFASWIGTTGAAMVLIRPLLRANAERRYKVHTIVFFIFLVANIGGSLTPLGDPPLFLGFLHSVPFFWTLSLFPHMLFVVFLLILVYFVLDSFYYRKEMKGKEEPPQVPGKIGVDGLYNLIFLAGILAATLISGMWHAGEVTFLGIHLYIQDLFRTVMMIVMGLMSLRVTPEALRRANEFGWFPIKEVAYLFAGIFMTIIPALAMLRAGQEGSLAFLVTAVQEPVHYFWITGTLSSFLDNAPTYLTFFNTCVGTFYTGMPEQAAVARLISEHNIYLKAIAASAVFMGANTYIGNAPNFMVKSIAEESGVPMPSFFGYIFKYALPILIPIFLLVTLIFFL